MNNANNSLVKQLPVYHLLSDSRELFRIVLMIALGGAASLIGWTWLQGTIGIAIFFLLFIVNFGNSYLVRVKPYGNLWFSKGAIGLACIVGFVIWSGVSAVL